jgi:hypothetical protein
MSKWRVVKWDNAGELQLVADAPVAAGEEILRETPLTMVLDSDIELGSAAWDLTHRLLADARLRDAWYALKLRSEDIFPPSAQDAEIERLLARRYRLPRPMVRKLYAGVRTNHIGFGAGDDATHGYGLYPTLGRVNHSCEPSAALETVDVASGEQRLLAKRAIESGQEITRNYAFETEGFLERNFLVRNVTLVNRFGFVCQCSRCRTERPEDLQGVNLMHFFRDFLRAQAEKSARQTQS